MTFTYRNVIPDSIGNDDHSTRICINSGALDKAYLYPLLLIFQLK